MIVASIKGGKELDALLQQLPVEVETKILGNALAAGAGIIRDEAKALVRRKSGKLAAGIKTAKSVDKGAGQVIARVKLTGPHAFVGHLLEGGVLAHMIWARAGKDSLVINGVPVGKKVHHPGFAPIPFMRPALDAKAAAAVDAVGEYLTKYLRWGSIQAPTVSVDEPA